MVIGAELPVLDLVLFVNAIHPGAVATELSRHIGDSYLAQLSEDTISRIREATNGFVWSSDEAALTQVYTSASPDIVEQKITGQYYTPLARLHHPTHTGATDEEAAKLWAFTDQILSERGFTDYTKLA